MKNKVKIEGGKPADTKIEVYSSVEDLKNAYTINANGTYIKNKKITPFGFNDDTEKKATYKKEDRTIILSNTSSEWNQKKVIDLFKTLLNKNPKKAEKLTPIAEGKNGWRIKMASFADATTAHNKLIESSDKLLKGKNYMSKLTLNVTTIKPYFIRVNCHFYGMWGIDGDNFTNFNFQIRKQTNQ